MRTAINLELEAPMHKSRQNYAAEQLQKVEALMYKITHGSACSAI